MTDDRLPLAELMAKTGDGDFLRTEPPRVFRRLLFVRRSHDECYKEQVFA
jgi:hypothetical protein